MTERAEAFAESAAATSAAAGDSTGSAGVGAHLFGALQYVLPQHALSRAVLRATRSRRVAFKNALIRGFMRLYAPDLSDAASPEPTSYESFNAFFTRALRSGARPGPADPNAVASPVDGTISEIGRLDGDHLLQAKGHRYSLQALLAGHDAWVQTFRGGHFATIYLAPYNYHRIHMACAGVLAAAWYVPGRLFSVNAATARVIPGLFARNERVVLAFEGAGGGHAIALIGALNVGCMETVWHGMVTPRAGRQPADLELPRPSPTRLVARGDELGRFNMGSTVILLFPPRCIEWAAALAPGRTVRVGDVLGHRVGDATSNASG
jgi:phosphatidylserine decarboxylase